jgi:hypothetical protein
VPANLKRARSRPRADQADDTGRKHDEREWHTPKEDADERPEMPAAGDQVSRVGDRET